MIAEEIKEYAYSFDEMCEVLGLAPATLKHRIYTRTCVPPFQKVGRTYWFPRELYLDWHKRQEIKFEVNSAS